ncbi:MAG: dihydrodipicolinate reductase, partial [Bacilli bacterium]|nr:dihydrodipicolinate reductase [Bacilli bacterium]
MVEKIRMFQIGCGKMSAYTMKYALKKGVKIVGAVDINPNLYGKDISYVIGGERRDVGIAPLEKLEEYMKATKPNIAIVTTMSLLNDVKDVLRICAKLGINAITTCEEAFYAQNSNPTIWKELDVLAKANKCTIIGCGYQDVFWGNLISVLAGTTHKIAKIKGSSSYNVEDYGIALAKAHGAGLTLEQFDKEVASVDRISEEERTELINSGKYSPSYMWNTVGWLADKFKLHITSMTQKCVPQTYSEDLESTTLGMKIKAGDATGMSAVVTAETEEGITIEAECIGKVYAPEEVDTNEWTIIGEPETTVTIKQPATAELTCADVINRIPDVFNARPGFISTSELPTPEYRLKNLNEYIK